MTDQELRDGNMDVVRQFITAFNEWDFDELENLVTEDFVFEFLFVPPGMARRVEGRRQVIDFWRPFAEAVRSENWFDISLDTRHSDPSEVILVCKSQFKFVDESREYGNDYISFFRVLDGRISWLQENLDTARLVEGFGGTVVSTFTAGTLEGH